MTMTGNHGYGHVDEFLPGYAFGILDEADHGPVVRHLRECARCRHIAQSDGVIAAQIGFAAPLHQPPAALRERVMARVGRESGAERESRQDESGRGGSALAWQEGARERRADTLFPRVLAPPAGHAAPTITPSPRRRPRMAGWLLAAAIIPWLLVAVLGVGLAQALHRPSPSSRPPLAIAQVGGLRGTVGRLAMTARDSSAFLMLTHVPSSPDHTAYVCWLERAGRMEQTGAFQQTGARDDAWVMLHASHPMREYGRVVVTLETRPLPEQPTGTVLASGHLR